MAEKKRLTAQELFAFSDEMSMILEGGISSLEGVTLMLEETEDKAQKAVLGAMEDTIVATGSFAAAVKESGVFPEYYEQMIEIGEQTGKTDEVLRRLSNHYRRENDIYEAVRSAVSYPLVMVTMMLVIILVLVTKIMPIFQRVFEQLGSSMNGVSGGILKLGSFLSDYALVFLLLLVAVAAFIAYLLHTAEGKRRLLAFACKFKVFRSIYEKITASRFASGMAMTLSSGMDMVQAVETAGKLAQAPGFEEKLAKCRAELEEHMDMGLAFSVSGIFSGLFGRMAVLSAKTGNLEQVMEKIADTYQEEADNEIHSLIAVVEPTLVIVLSLIVGMILLSVMLPLLSIMSGMR